MKKEWKNGIKDNVKTRTNKPRISTKELVEILKEHYKPPEYIEPQEVFNEIKKINNNISQIKFS